MNNKMIISLVAAIVALSGCETTSTRFNNSTKIAAENGKVCKREKTTGSYIPTITCGTPEEIAAMELKSKGFIENMHRKPSARGN